MVLDNNIIQECTPTEELISHLEDKLNKFSLAFPNWQYVYKFAKIFFHW